MPSWVKRIIGLPFAPFLVQLVVTRRCNLKCGYCNEYDNTSDPVPHALLRERMAQVSALGAWGLELTGGEPLLHPDIIPLVEEATRIGFVARMMISNGYLLNERKVESLNAAGLTDLQISIDGVEPNDTTVKVLKPLRSRLEMLARLARFRVTMSAVIGAAPPAEVREVVRFAKQQGFRPRVLLLHDGSGAIHLSPQDLELFQDLQEYLHSGAREANQYRNKLVRGQPAPFKCRAGSRYLYIDENGDVARCYHKRHHFLKSLAEYSRADLRAQFYAYKPCNPFCTLGCARTTSKFDEWRSQHRDPGGDVS